jgi:hypothetical protein
MKDIILNFKLYCCRNKIEEIDADLVNDYMFENSLYGKDIYSTLINIKL